MHNIVPSPIIKKRQAMKEITEKQNLMHCEESNQDPTGWEFTD